MKKALIIIAILLVIFAIGLILFNFIIMPMLVKVKEVAVPDLIGKSINEARKIVEDAELNLYIESRRPDPVYPEGIIIIQEPLPGSYVSAGRQISVVVSSGVEKIRIPDITGLDVEKGLIILKNRELKPQVESIPSETTAGVIMATYPPADSLVSVRSNIKLVVSSGPEICMPLLEGKSIEDALKIMREYDVILAIDTAQTGGDTNVVILQYPDAGSKLQPRDSVRILIAR